MCIGMALLEMLLSQGFIARPADNENVRFPFSQQEPYSRS
jgi:hypothetical protein